MLEDELANRIPGYRIADCSPGDKETILSLVNEASGERFAIDALRIEQLVGGADHLGKSISERLTLHAAGMSVDGVRKLTSGSPNGALQPAGDRALPSPTASHAAYRTTATSARHPTQDREAAEASPPTGGKNGNPD
ncbi:hypothetical protein [Pseudomonas subflava]|uniref:hypothetical protein n=1 Tax=Pseudomonas subflava TaxID=2952933 RepID=UPI00207A0EF5|nr:hypothetical protein [Pseudomonas subflava]